MGMVSPFKMAHEGMTESAVGDGAAGATVAATLEGDTSHSLTSGPLVPMLLEADDLDDNGDLLEEDRIVQVSSVQDVELGSGSGHRSKLHLPSSSHNGSESTTLHNPSSSHRNSFFRGRINHRHIFTAVILLVGSAASTALMTTGILSARTEQHNRFQRLADEFTSSLEDAWHDYEIFGLWIHEACRSKPNEVRAPTANASNLGICTRDEFRDVYEYIVTFNVDFQSAQFMPNVSAAARAGLEYEGREYFARNYPNTTYNGITKIVRNTNGSGVSIVPQTEQPFYWPVHYLEPVEGNENAIELDIYSSSTQQKTIDQATTSWKPAVTDRLKLVQDTDPNAYSIILHHPGVPVSSYNQQTKPSEIAIIVIRMPALLARSARLVLDESLTVYVFDTHDASSPEPLFLGGVMIQDQVDRPSNLTYLEEKLYTTLPENGSTRHTERFIYVGDRQWIVIIESVVGTFVPEVLFVVIGGMIIFSASVVLAFWFHAHLNRMNKLNELKSQADAEKAALLVETARKQASMERQLNEYIAHEVRNPLSSAITALSFVSAAAEDMDQESSATSRETLQEDVGIVHSSLQFIDELLRNMLDMHRASDRHITITLTPVRLDADVFDPVASILKSRVNTVSVEVLCPPGLVVHADPLRLKQIVLNLTMNSLKYVEQGFVRMSAEIVNGNVRLLIDDSGPGIPPAKRARLFAKFQESLDLLDQGVGIGICLSKHLADLMDSNLFLDETYDSGVRNCPGTRFVVDLRRGPLVITANSSQSIFNATDTSTEMSDDVLISLTNGIKPHRLDDGNVDVDKAKLPESLSALFVDDDVVLRKLFVRSLRRVAETWTVQEAGNGETALSLCDTNSFDIIFVDQYMTTTSVDRQLLGTETVREMRIKGVTAKICGLSANDVEDEFLQNGADTFIKKPYPCEKNALEQVLVRVLYGKHEEDGSTSVF